MEINQEAGSYTVTVNYKAFYIFFFSNLILLFFFFGVCVCMSILPAFISKRKPDSLEMELQTVLSCRVGAGNQSHVLWKSS